MRLLCISLCFILCVSAPLQASLSAPKQLTQAQAKLVIILNFINKYSSWPGGYDLGTTGFVNVCSIGQDDVTQELPVLAKASSERLRVNILTDQPHNKINQCHVLYIAESAAWEVPSLIKQTAGSPTLTVSGYSQFIEIGGVVGITEHVKRQGNFEKFFVRYEVNNRSAMQRGLRIDPDALELAARVIR